MKNLCTFHYVFATLKSVFDERVMSHGLYTEHSLEPILHD